MNLSDSSLWAYFTYYGAARFTHWIDGTDTDGVCFGIEILPDGTQLVAFEGSHDALDWWRNFQICRMQHPRLGAIDAGLYAGIPAALPKIKGLIDKTKPVLISGHSRGGSNAIYTGAELLLDGYQVSVRAFNPPRTQYQSSERLSEIYQGKDITIMRVSGDPVSLEPPSYSHPIIPVEIPVAPVTLDLELSMKYHHMQLCMVAAMLREGGFA